MRVTVYTRCDSCNHENKYPECSDCYALQEFLSENRISYEVEEISKYNHVFTKKHIFPLIRIRDKFVEGFDQGKLENLLNIQDEKAK